MKALKDYILTEKLKLNTKSKAFEYHFHPEDFYDLRSLLEQLLEKRGKDADFNDIDVSKITYMSTLFYDLDPHNIDISEWDVSNVEDMAYMFKGCSEFNCDLSHWNVSNVKNMEYMFKGCYEFNSDLSSWNINNVKNTRHMFDACASLKNTPSWYKE